MTCFSNEEERSAELDDVVPFLLESKLKERGAHIETAEPSQEKVVTDGRLVTGQNPASATGVGQALADVIRQQAVVA
jgi:putative intracellular protease/amidase